MAKRQPMGALSRIPLEVRIEVYGLLFSGPYHHIPAPEKGFSYSKTTKAADLAILRVSISVSEEALEVFYGKHIFNFHTESLGRRHLRLSQSHPAAAFLKTINLHIEAFRYPEGFVGTTLYLGAATRASFASICSSGVAKDICHVLLKIGKWMGKYRLKQAVLDDIQALTMFKTVMVEVEGHSLRDDYFSLGFDRDGGDGSRSTPVSEVREGRRSDWVSVPEDEIATALRYILEPTLGPGGPEVVAERLCYISFHPQEHLGKLGGIGADESSVGQKTQNLLWSRSDPKDGSAL